MLTFASFVVIYVERPDPVKQNLDRVRMKMTRGSVELIMGPPDIVTEHPLAGHIDVLIFKANGANAEVQIDRESGWVVNKGWCPNRPTSEWCWFGGGWSVYARRTSD